MSRYYRRWDSRRTYRNNQYNEGNLRIGVILGVILVGALIFIYHGGGLLLQPIGFSQSPPSNIGVTVQIEKDPVYHTINALFSGGKGQAVTDYCIVRVTRSDGRIVSKQLEPVKLAEVQIQGTEGPDRVEVFVVYLSGNTYRIYDSYLPNRKYYDGV
jgi:hypothetical protein